MQFVAKLSIASLLALAVVSESRSQSADVPDHLVRATVRVLNLSAGDTEPRGGTGFLVQRTLDGSSRTRGAKT